MDQKTGYSLIQVSGYLKRGQVRNIGKVSIPESEVDGLGWTLVPALRWVTRAEQVGMREVLCR
jgi:hypothetical protein